MLRNKTKQRNVKARVKVSTLFIQLDYVEGWDFRVSYECFWNEIQGHSVLIRPFFSTPNSWHDVSLTSLANIDLNFKGLISVQEHTRNIIYSYKTKFSFSQSVFAWIFSAYSIYSHGDGIWQEHKKEIKQTNNDYFVSAFVFTRVYTVLTIVYFRVRTQNKHPNG